MTGQERQEAVVYLTADELTELSRGLACRLHWTDTDEAKPLLVLLDRLNETRDDLRART